MKWKVSPDNTQYSKSSAFPPCVTLSSAWWSTNIWYQRWSLKLLHGLSFHTRLPGQDTTVSVTLFLCSFSIGISSELLIPIAGTPFTATISSPHLIRREEIHLSRLNLLTLHPGTPRSSVLPCTRIINLLKWLLNYKDKRLGARRERMQAQWAAADRGSLLSQRAREKKDSAGTWVARHWRASGAQLAGLAAEGKVKTKICADKRIDHQGLFQLPDQPMLRWSADKAKALSHSSSIQERLLSLPALPSSAAHPAISHRVVQFSCKDVRCQS